MTRQKNLADLPSILYLSLISEYTPFKHKFSSKSNKLWHEKGFAYIPFFAIHRLTSQSLRGVLVKKAKKVKTPLDYLCEVSYNKVLMSTIVGESDLQIF